MLKAGNILQCILWYANRLFELCDAAVVTKPRNGKKSAANAIITTKGYVVVINMPRLRRGKEVRKCISKIFFSLIDESINISF